MERRKFIGASAAASVGLIACKTTAAMPSNQERQMTELKGNINHSACRWCYSKIPMEEFLQNLNELGVKAMDLTEAEASYFVFTDSVRNNAYDPKNDRINILFKDGSTKDLSQAADLLNISVLSDTVEKHLMCYTKV